MAGGPVLWTTAGAGNLSAILTTIFADDITNNIQRACPLPQLLPVRTGRGKNIAWVAKFTQPAGYTNGGVADGADVAVYNSDRREPATLQYTSYIEAIAVGGRAQAAAMAAGNPLELADLLAEEVRDANERLALIVAQEFYTGTGSGNNQLNGLYSAQAGAMGGLMATGVYAGIDRATYAEWAGNAVLNGGVNRALTIELMRDTRRTITNACGMKPDLIVTDPIQFEKYGNLLQNSRRLTQEVTIRGQKIVLDGGFTALDFDGVPVIEDPNHPAHRMSFLNTREVYITQLQAPTGVAASNDVGQISLAGTPEYQFGDGNVKLTARIKHLAEAGDAFRAELICYPQIVVRRPNACGYLGDLLD